MQQVGESFRMHQAMFDGGIEHLHQLGMAFFRALKGVLDGVIEFFTHAVVIAVNFLRRGPIFGSVGWQSTADGIDSEREKFIEDSMEGAQTESALRKEIPVKGFEVTQVENDAVSLGDGPLVESLFANQLEKFVGTRTRFQQAGMKIVTDADSSCGECSHSFGPFF